MQPDKKSKSSAPVPDESTDPPTRSHSKSKRKRRKSDQGPLSTGEVDTADASTVQEGKPKSSEPQSDMPSDPPTKSKSKKKRGKSDHGPRSTEDSQPDVSDISAVREGKRKSSAPQSDRPTDTPTRLKSEEEGKKSDLVTGEVSQQDASTSSTLREKKKKKPSAPESEMPSEPPTMSKSKGKRRKSDQGPRSLEASQAEGSDASAPLKEKGKSPAPQGDVPSEPPTTSKSKGKHRKSDQGPPMPAEASQGADTLEAQPVGIPPEQKALSDAATRSMLFLGAQTSSAAPVAYMGLPPEVTTGDKMPQPEHGVVAKTSEPGNVGDTSRSPPDAPDCWLVVVSSAIYIFFAMALMKSESALYVGVKQMFNLSNDSETGAWPLTVSVTLSQLAGPLYGVLGTWLSDRILLLFGAFCCSVPVMVSSLAHEIWEITVTYGVFTGLGLACEEVMPFAVVSRHFVRYRGAAMGVLFVVTALAGFVAPLGIVALRSNLGFRTALLVIGALELNMFWGGVFVDRVAVPTPNPPAIDDQRPGPRGEMAPGTQRQSPTKRLLHNLVSLSTIPFFHVASSRAISLFGLQTFLVTAEVFGHDTGFEAYKATSLVSAYAAGDMVARIGTGIALDYKILSGAYLMLWTFAVHTASMLVLGYVTTYWLMIGSCFISGICAGSRIFAANIMVAEYFEDQVLQLSLGVMNFVAGIIILVRPPIIGYSKDVLGSYTYLYTGLGVCYGLFAASWALSCLWKRLKKLGADGPVKEVKGGALPGKPN